jgi:hypothetical protein
VPVRGAYSGISSRLCKQTKKLRDSYLFAWPRKRAIPLPATNATRPHSLGDVAAINVLVRISAIADETSCPHQIERDIAFARYYGNWKLSLVRDKQNHSKKARCVECGVTE